MLLSPNNTNTKPYAFLNYILFDEEYNVLEAKSIALGAANTVHSLTTGTITIKEVGYMFIYLSYDSNDSGSAYFDEFKIEHIESPVLQISQYYPFGMLANSWIRDGETENRYEFQGKNYDSLTQWHDFTARQYDATLGRWFAVDPDGQFASPYMAMGNSPVMGVDPNGKYFFVPIIVGAIVGAASGYISARSAGARGLDLWAYAFAGAGMGMISAGVGATVGASVLNSTASGVLSSVAAGSAAGATGGFFGASLAGTNTLRGAWEGMVVGGIGTLAGSLLPGGGGALLGGAASGLTNNALHDKNLLEGALIGAGTAFASYHLMALMTFSRKTGNTMFDNLSLTDKYRFSRAAQRTLKTQKEFGYDIYEDGSRSRMIKSQGEWRFVNKFIKGKFWDPRSQTFKKKMVMLDFPEKSFNMVDLRSVRRESSVMSFHTHLSIGTTEFSGLNGDQGYAIMSGMEYMFMLNGSEIHYWNLSSYAPQYVGETNLYLMRSIFGY